MQSFVRGQILQDVDRQFWYQCRKLDFLGLPDHVIRSGFRTVGHQMICSSTLQASWRITLAGIHLEPLISLLLPKRIRA